MTRPTPSTTPPTAPPHLGTGGSCTLVGAGPGDPELLTLKALKAIQAATVLLVDDLVSDEVRRSRGSGKMLLDWLENQARNLDCGALALDSGVQRHGAHRFYFREGLHVSAYSFKKVLK